MDWEFYFKIVRLIGGRYILFAGIAFLLCYVLLTSRIRFRKIQTKFPAKKDYYREIIYSLSTILIFSFVPLFLIRNENIRPFTTYYTDLNEWGIAYLILAFPLMLFMHDTYFYWVHRLIHHPRIFKYVHLLHHRSTNPSPWAAYAFHPLEAVFEVGIVVIFLFTIPMHKIHFFLFFLFMIIYNVYGHTGWELYPKGFNRHWLGKWINTSVNHNQHHQYFKGNYGLYFLFWDRWMGTIREDYDEAYDKVTG